VAVISYRITSLILGLIIAGIIIVLVRKDLLHTRYSILWICFAGAAAFLGMFPQLSDWVAAYLGVRYPPILFVIVVIGAILVKMLTMDIDRSRQEQHIRKINEKLAILEGGTYPELISDLTKLAGTDEAVARILKHHFSDDD
jgi:hypothetical protein